MARHGDARHIHLGPPPQQAERGRHLVELLAVEQLHLQPVPALLAACVKGSAHQVAVGRALTRRQTKALAKQEEEHVSLSSKDITQNRRVRRLRGVGGTGAAVAEDDGGKRPGPGRPPDQRAQFKRSALHGHGFRTVPRRVLTGEAEQRRKNQRSNRNCVSRHALPAGTETTRMPSAVSIHGDQILPVLFLRCGSRGTGPTLLSREPHRAVFGTPTEQFHPIGF